jgi:fibro-slime domain-containing protein
VAVVAAAALAPSCGSSSSADDDDDGGSSGEDSAGAGGSSGGGTPGGRGGAGGKPDASAGTDTSAGGSAGGTAHGGTSGAGDEAGAGASGGSGATGGDGSGGSQGGSDAQGGSGGGAGTQEAGAPASGGTSGSSGSAGQGSLGRECGDGIRGGSEECDDANSLSGDGCDACELEPGFACVDKICSEEACRIRIPAVFRDFNAAPHTGGHVDFADANDLRNPVPGLVEDMLDADAKPVFTGLAGGDISSPTSFAQWYRDVSPLNARTDGSLLLFEDRLNTVFTNRSNDKGDRFRGFPIAIGDLADAQYCGESCDEAACDVAAPRECTDPCAPWGGASDSACTATAEYFDGDPLFFPLDGATNVLDEPRATATLPPSYGYDYDPEPGGALHNFYFTSEIRFRARYAAGNSAAIDFATDDDGWVFVNGQLAIDTGGKHTPYHAQMVISEATSYGLSDGDIYEIAVFHADRSATGATFLLYVTALDWVPTCYPIE